MDTLVQKLRCRNGLLTIAEVSSLLSFHPVTLRDWAREGRLPALLIAGQWRFDPAELAGWVAARRMGQEFHQSDSFSWAPHQAFLQKAFFHKFLAALSFGYLQRCYPDPRDMLFYSFSRSRMTSFDCVEPKTGNWRLSEKPFWYIYAKYVKPPTDLFRAPIRMPPDNRHDLFHMTVVVLFE
jgi:excisionase family DNA binding protein